MEYDDSIPPDSNGTPLINGEHTFPPPSGDGEPHGSRVNGTNHRNGVHSKEHCALSALLEGNDFLPDKETSQALYDAVCVSLFSGKKGLTVTDVCLTSRSMDSNELEATEEKEYDGESTTYGKLTCDLTTTSFWLPVGSRVPVVAFQTTGGEDDTTKIVHPRLVAAGPENVKRALVRWVRSELMEVADRLRSTLENLETLRTVDSLQTGWPSDYSTEPDGTYAIDPSARVPVVDDETKPRRAYRRFNYLNNTTDS